jgi:hypothetical protein
MQELKDRVPMRSRRAVIAAKGFDVADATLRAAIRDQALTPLRVLRKRGIVEQTGLGRGVRWKLALA